LSIATDSERGVYTYLYIRIYIYEEIVRFRLEWPTYHETLGVSALFGLTPGNIAFAFAAGGLAIF
jgi:hypothetical protein